MVAVRLRCTRDPARKYMPGEGDAGHSITAGHSLPALTLLTNARFVATGIAVNDSADDTLPPPTALAISRDFPLTARRSPAMSAILSADGLNDFISPGVACIKPVETLPAAPPRDESVCRSPPLCDPPPPLRSPALSNPLPHRTPTRSSAKTRPRRPTSALPRSPSPTVSRAPAASHPLKPYWCHSNHTTRSSPTSPPPHPTPSSSRLCHRRPGRRWQLRTA